MRLTNLQIKKKRERNILNIPVLTYEFSQPCLRTFQSASQQSAFVAHRKKANKEASFKGDRMMWTGSSNGGVKTFDVTVRKLYNLHGG